MFPVLALGGERGRAELAEKLDHLAVLLDVFLEVSWMSELPVAVRAGEPGLVGVRHQVIVEAVLPGEGRPAQRTLEWSEAGVTPVVSQQSAVGREGPGWVTQTTDQVIRGGSP